MEGAGRGEVQDGQGQTEPKIAAAGEEKVKRRESNKFQEEERKTGARK